MVASEQETGKEESIKTRRGKGRREKGREKDGWLVGCGDKKFIRRSAAVVVSRSWGKNGGGVEKRGKGRRIGSDTCRAWTRREGSERIGGEIIMLRRGVCNDIRT